MIPSVGRIVHLRLSGQCATEVNRRRAHALEKAADVQRGRMLAQHGEQIHHGNDAKEGDIYPLIITRIWAAGEATDETCINGQVFLDGNDVLWVTSIKQGDGPGNWFEPPRV